MREDVKARVIAFYLPQFHPIPENDKWWGKGFTEWTNVGKARPLFKGHYQPKVPADLGYYDLRMPEVREAQAELARNAGIEGFCYWHYWFGEGRQILERPFAEVLKSGKPDFPFCLAWANHNWTNKTWEVGTRKVKESMLIEQKYGGIKEYEMHFNALLPAFKDERYIRVDNKPLFVVFDPDAIPDKRLFIDTWQKLALKNGLDGLHIVASVHSLLPEDKKLSNLLFPEKLVSPRSHYDSLLSEGFDAIESTGHLRAEYCCRHFLTIITNTLLKRCFKYSRPLKHKMKDINDWIFTQEDRSENVYPTLFPNWDRSPRSGKKSLIFVDSTPSVFKDQISQALDLIEDKSLEHRILFLRSWNEWGEGNYVEPDLRYGHGYLDALRETILK